MEDLTKLEQQLRQQGKLDAVKQLAQSPDAAQLAAQLPQNGDADAMRKALTQLLKTDAGRRLAQQVKDAMEHG